jgi:uncharacterized membrane protein
MLCSVILLPIAITFYTTWWFIRFVDGFFSPIYIHLGINVFGNYLATHSPFANSFREIFSSFPV